ncbi:MAG: aspartate-semialdehyde dehydrogenase [Planctomycetota bacterium]
MTRAQPHNQRLQASRPLRLAIVGATGAVGQEFLRVLEQRAFPIKALRLLASARSAGTTMDFAGKPITVEELTENSFADVDIALFSAGGSISKRYAQHAVEAGAVVVDNSSCFRMTDGVPLVVPEVNPEAVADANIGLGEGQSPGIIANPNCSTILMLVAVTPLHRAAGVKRMVVSTYQAASGAGAAAMRELEQQTREALDPANDGQVLTKDIFPFQYAFNLFSHNSPMGDNGYNEEEMKMVHETHKIWNNAKQTAITTTCVRVPVMRAHAESINLTFENRITEDEARAILAKAPGVSLIDDRAGNRFPTPLDASHQDDVFVGRIRRDISQPEGTAIDLFLCGDQVRKGAALNAVQIAELLL